MTLDKETIQGLISFVQDSNEVREGLQEKVATLEAQKEQLTEKLASAEVPRERLEQTVKLLIEAGSLNAGQAKQAIEKMASDHEFVLTCLEELAKTESEHRKTVPRLGVPVFNKAASADNDRRPESERVWEDGVKELQKYVGK